MNDYVLTHFQACFHSQVTTYHPLRANVYRSRHRLPILRCHCPLTSDNGVEIPSGRIQTGQVYWLSSTLDAGPVQVTVGYEQACKLRCVCRFTICQVPSSRPVCPAYPTCHAYGQPKTNRWPKTSSPFIAPAHPAIPRSATGCGVVLRMEYLHPSHCLFSAGGGISLKTQEGRLQRVQEPHSAPLAHRPSTCPLALSGLCSCYNVQRLF